MKFHRIKNSIITKLPISDDERRVLDRRLNKLTRDPRGFLKGSYNKRSAQLIGKTPIKYRGSNDFTVVSAVYNVEKYLDDYFKSLFNQSLSFKKHIQLILVDDGSTDSSAEIIKKWQKKYPNNIKYFYKGNGGQASARNLGLNHVDTEWVTFIDPDDFIDRSYFEEVDKILTCNKEVDVVACNLKFFMEDKIEVKNSHPLKYKFKQNSRVVPIEKLDKDIHMHAASTIFKVNSSILNSTIMFNENIKPNFEDSKFVIDYFYNNPKSLISFSKNAVYFYRKRSDGTSTLDNSWADNRLYSDVYIHGVIPVLENYKLRDGKVPKNIQRTILYHMSWYFKRLVNKSYNHEILSEPEIYCFLKLMESTFLFIESSTILEFNLSGIWFLEKVGILGRFKNEKPSMQIAYIQNVDREKKQILVSYFTYFDVLDSFRLNNTEVFPKFKKLTHHTFMKQLFVKEVRLWIPFDNENSLFTVVIDQISARISLHNRKHVNSIRIRDILKAYDPSYRYVSDNSWLFMDRNTQADDNAEHLYRYLMHNHPEQKKYFALNRDSIDWLRLQEEGFNLIEFGTKDFEFHLSRASKIISSHLDRYINDYFNDNYEFSKKFIFLQHGVIKDDMSIWLNTKKNLDLFITTTIPEYRSLVENGGPYKLTEKEVVLTGLPRHDQLLNDNISDSKIILIMPTWRESAVGKIVNHNNIRTINSDFMETPYAKHWYGVFHNKHLEKLVEKYNYKVIFAPHSNIEPYLKMFDTPSYIEIWHAGEIATSIQQLFQRSKVMITDYSSVAFEMGLLGKTTLYYQFDKDEFFSGGHTYQQGYFDYEKDGFGPVVTEETDLLTELEKILANNGNTLEPYLTRVKETFAYRDTNNCKRVYDAIIDLDRPDTSEVSVDTIMEYAQQAIIHDAWDLALERIENALQYSDITQEQLENITQIKEQVIQTGYQDEPVKLANILWKENRIEGALNALKQVDSVELTDELLRLRVKLAILNNDFKLARNSQKLLLESYNELCTIEDWQFYTQLATI